MCVVCCSLCVECCLLCVGYRLLFVVDCCLLSVVCPFAYRIVVDVCRLMLFNDFLCYVVKQCFFMILV